jgi:hypothetical protein
VESADSSLADEGNKENWDHTTDVDIHKILQTLERDVESDAGGKLFAFWSHEQVACFIVYVKYSS